MTISLDIIRWNEVSPERQQALLARPALPDRGQSEAVADIIRQVRADGDAALERMSREFDGVAPQPFIYGPEDMRAAEQRVSPEFISVLNDASDRIARFHQADRPRDGEVETAKGLTCRVQYQALSPVGLYIPGGSAPLVSTVLMLALPARLAGCQEIVLCTPPGPDGRIAVEILAAASLCGVTAVFCVGGAQAVAAMAYGTASVPRCAKIFGPGNSWVTEAKQQVSMDPQGAAIDLPAGPSEVLVIADEDANPEFVAWDLLSQAEHGPDSQVILLTDSAELAERVAECTVRFAGRSPRRDILAQSLDASRIICLDDLQQALELSNEYAPEHLILNTADADDLATRVINAGSVFIGPWTPESLGDYCSGTNHVLPTYGWARSHGALGTADFMRRMTFQRADREALARVGPTAEALAAFEGLDAHRMAVTARLAAEEPGS